jgi:cephalosporin-C deacetylase-like acetyl esterase
MTWVKLIMMVALLFSGVLAIAADVLQDQFQQWLKGIEISSKETPRPPLEAKILTDHPDAIYKKGEEIKFSVMLYENGKVLAGKKLTWTIEGDGGYGKSGEVTSSASPVTVTAKLDMPGYVRFKIGCVDADGKPVQFPYFQQSGKVVANVNGGVSGAMVDPLEIKASMPEPDNFDEFWNKIRKEVAIVPMKAELKPLKLPDKFKNAEEKVEAWEVKVACAGGKPMTGLLVKPINAAKGKHPIYISYQSGGVFGGRWNLPVSHAVAGAICLEVEAHGIEANQSKEYYENLAKGELKDYINRNSDDPEKFYFRGMYMRILRSLEYMKSIPEWDGENIIIFGDSQGGTQALVAAGFDPQVTLCVARVPGWCDNTGSLLKRIRGMDLVKYDGVNPINPQNEMTGRLYDVVNFASRIKCEVYVSTGFIDNYCPPNGVYAAFNNIPSTNKHIMGRAGWWHNAFCIDGVQRIDSVLTELKKKQ